MKLAHVAKNPHSLRMAFLESWAFGKDVRWKGWERIGNVVTIDDCMWASYLSRCAAGAEWGRGRKG